MEKEISFVVIRAGWTERRRNWNEGSWKEHTSNCKINKYWAGRSQDGKGRGRGDHFLFYKFIERSTERWTKFTIQLLIASSWHQAPRKAAHCLRREGKKNCFSFFFFFNLFFCLFFFFYFFFFFFFFFLFFLFFLLFCLFFSPISF